MLPQMFWIPWVLLDLDEEGSWAREVVFEVVFSGDSDGKESASNVYSHKNDKAQ